MYNFKILTVKVYKKGTVSLIIKYNKHLQKFLMVEIDTRNSTNNKKFNSFKRSSRLHAYFPIEDSQENLNCKNKALYDILFRQYSALATNHIDFIYERVINMIDLPLTLKEDVLNKNPNFYYTYKTNINNTKYLLSLTYSTLNIYHDDMNAILENY